MSHLIHHVIEVTFINQIGNIERVARFETADPHESKKCVRQIAHWLSMGEGFRVERRSKLNALDKCPQCSHIKTNEAN